MSDANGPTPRARQERLVVEELPDETLVYDLKRHKAHCLNRTSALVWRHCDGHTTLAEMAALLETEVGIPADEAVVWMALDRLGRARLLQEQVSLPAGVARYSRREAMRRVGLGAGLALVALPVVETIVAPHAAAQGSCITRDECRNNFSPPCPGTCLSDRPGECCVQSTPNSCDKGNCP